MRRTADIDEPKELVISGDGGRLIIQITQSGPSELWWARCHLEATDRRIYLGAGTQEDLLSRLLRDLENPPPGITGAACLGRDAHHIVSLSEAWCGIYVALDGSTRTLFFLDGLCDPVCSIGHIALSELQWTAARARGCAQG